MLRDETLSNTMVAIVGEIAYGFRASDSTVPALGISFRDPRVELVSMGDAIERRCAYQPKTKGQRRKPNPLYTPPKNGKSPVRAFHSGDFPHVCWCGCPTTKEGICTSGGHLVARTNSGKAH
jgi:hypothetical protein